MLSTYSLGVYSTNDEQTIKKKKMHVEFKMRKKGNLDG